MALLRPVFGLIVRRTALPPVHGAVRNLFTYPSGHSKHDRRKLASKTKTVRVLRKMVGDKMPQPTHQDQLRAGMPKWMMRRLRLQVDRRKERQEEYDKLVEKAEQKVLEEREELKNYSEWRQDFTYRLALRQQDWVKAGVAQGTPREKLRACLQARDVPQNRLLTYRTRYFDSPAQLPFPEDRTPERHGVAFEELEGEVIYDLVERRRITRPRKSKPQDLEEEEQKEEGDEEEGQADAQEAVGVQDRRQHTAASLSGGGVPVEKAPPKALPSSSSSAR
eukprot:RCo030996